MVGACVEEGWWACFENIILIGVWSEGQEEERMTKEDVEDEIEKERKSVGEKGCHELSKMESGTDCCQSGVNLATPIYGPG